MSSFTDSLQTGDALDATSTRTGEQTGASLMNQWLWAASWLFFCIFLMSCQTSTCDIKLTWPRPPTPRAVTSCWVSAVTPQISCSHQTVFNLFIVFVQMTQKFAQLHFITFMPQIRILQTPSVLNELHHKTDGNIQVHMKLSASVTKTLYKQSK